MSGKKSFLIAKQEMGIAALLMGFSILISRFMGLIRDKVISWQFGASGETDLYFAAFVLPDFINYLLAGGYVSVTIIPLLSKLFADNDKPWEFFSCIFIWTSLAICFFSTLGWIFAPEIVYYLAPGFSEEQLSRLSYFLRIILPAQVCFLPGACFSALLYIRKQFFVPALMPLIYNGFILLCGISLPYFNLVKGMEGFCFGVLIGAFIGSVLLPYLAVKSGGLTWHLTWHHHKFKYFIYLTLPLMLGQSIVVLDEQFIRIFGSMADEGEVSLLSYARRIMMVPVGVVAQAAGVASFPFLAGLIAKNDKIEFQSTLNLAITNTIIIIIPISCFMFVLAEQILGLIFEGGQFTAKDTILAAPLLQIMLLAVPFWAIQQIVGRAFYAHQDTLSPAIIGSLITLLSLPFYFYFSPLLGGHAIALIASCSIIFYTFCLYLYAHKKFLSDLKILCLFLKNILLCLIPMSFSYLLILISENFLLVINADLFANHTAIKHLFNITLSGLGFALSYLLLAKFFMPNNFNLILLPIISYFRKKKAVRE